MNRCDVLVIGELNLDLILNDIQGFPAMGQEIVANEMNLMLGSSSAIFACNIATLGMRTAFWGMVGEDAFSRMIIEALQVKNVDTTGIVVSPKYKTGITLVLNYEQDRANVTYGGAMETFSKAHMHIEQLAHFRHLHVSSYFLQKGLQKDIPILFKSAKEQGLTTSFDMQWDPANTWHFPYQECLPHVDVFLPNEAELLALTKEADLHEGLKKLGEHANKIVVKRGSEGALCYEKGRITSAEAFLNNNHFVDAIGAGDSFNAGFICKALSGCSVEECLQFANLAGAVNTTAPGGTMAFGSLHSFKKKAKDVFNIAL